MKTNLKLKKAIKLRSEQDNLRIKALNKGVELTAPETIFLSKDTTFGKNVKIEPYVVIGSKVKIGNNVTIKSFSHLEGAKLERNVTVGPYARIRPGSHFLPGSKVGNFVEIKNSKIGSHSKANHLSYLGDANIGINVNVGAGTITCNYDGVAKHKTIIEDNVFIGSNTELVAPLKIDTGSTVAAGSTITKDVAPNSLAISRNEQKQINRWRRSKK